MTIAAVPPQAIDVMRVSPPNDAPAAGFDELLTGAQARDTNTEHVEPARPRPVRPDKDAASESDEPLADEATEETIESNSRSSEDEPATAESGAGGTTAPATPTVAPQPVGAPTLPDSGIDVIVLGASAALEAASEIPAEVAAVAPPGDTVASIATTRLASVPTTTPARDAVVVATSDSAPEPAQAPAPVLLDTAPVPPEGGPAVRDLHSAAGATRADAPPTIPTGTTTGITTDPSSEPVTAGATALATATAPVVTVEGTGTSRPDVRAVAPPPAPAVEVPAVVAALPTTVMTTADSTDETARPMPAAPAPTPITGREVPQVAFAPAVAVNTVATVGAAAAPAAAEQVVAVLRPLRQAPDGSYRLRLELRPPELGRIELRVEMRDGVLSASLHTDNEGAAHTLRDALGDLRVRLEQDGVRAGALTVDGGRTGQRQDRNSTTARPDADVSDSTESLALPAEPAASDSVLDVRL